MTDQELIAYIAGVMARCDVHKGDEGSQVYLVLDGKLKALTTSDEGDDVVFTILGPGELIGEIAFLGSPVRTATVSTLTDCSLLAIDRRDFLAFLKRHPEAVREEALGGT